ncbi:MAG: DUF3343 domain-containing protein [Syntrophales bacterium]|jgi:hypothetical protein|nr:DUF3343 domain-containing protein [Syntrophales bacterium]
MDQPEDCDVVLFHSVTHAMKAEKLLKAAGLTIKLIPVPKHISSDCGVCLRFPREQQEAVVAALEGQVDIREIRPFC